MKMQRVAAVGLVISFGVVTGFSALEGVSSLILLAGRVLTYHEPSFNERLHTRYDPELGWVNQPNVFIADMYGAGVFLKTNAQGFRNDHDVAPRAPDRQLRIICSGDSFTLGYGVDNDHTWCQRLAARDQRFESVNMGEGGYGLDQTYLWYMRDGRALDHAVHLFAFITGNFHRMQQRSFLGHGKPVLVLENGGVVVRNVPVPKLRLSWLPRVTRRLVVALTELRSAELLRKVQARLRSQREGVGRGFNAATWEVAEQVFRSLQESDQAQGSVLLLVYLPTKSDYLGSESDPWRERLGSAAERDGFLYVDLVVPFRRLTGDEMKGLFIPEGLPGAGHYNDAGHQWVADQLYEWLVHVPAVASRLARLGSGPSSESLR